MKCTTPIEIAWIMCQLFTWDIQDPKFNSNIFIIKIDVKNFLFSFFKIIYLIENLINRNRFFHDYFNKILLR